VGHHLDIFRSGRKDPIRAYDNSAFDAEMRERRPPSPSRGDAQIELQRIGYNVYPGNNGSSRSVE